MKKIPLGEFLADGGTQQQLADALGVHQSAISQMVRSGRNIEVTVFDDGSLEANEIRPVPARPKKSAA